MSQNIPYGRQSISEKDVHAVIEVLRSDYLTQGPVVPEFERRVLDCCNVKYAVAVNSATSALHIACLALGVKHGDIVWTTPITFAASANCALYCGASIDFVDIDPITYNVSLESLGRKLEKAKIDGVLPKVFIPVHLSGLPCDLIEIKALSLRYGFKIIEDASHAIGARYLNEPIGNCHYSDITVFSFHPVKIITTGEGGMALTNDEGLARKMQLLRGHGITRAQEEMTHLSDGPWYYQQLELGFNYRMSDIHAALGLSQMDRLNEFILRRRDIAKKYYASLSDIPISLPYYSDDRDSAHHLYIVRLGSESAGPKHKRVIINLLAEGVGVNLHYIPIYLHPYYQRMGFKPGHCPEAEKYYSEAISLPIYSDLDEQQQLKVIETFKRLVK